MPRGLFKSFHTWAAITIAGWSLAYVLTRLALQHFSALPLGFLRYAVAVVALVALAIATGMRSPDKRDIPLFLISGMTGFFLYMVAFNIGTSYVTAATSSVVIASVPVMTALFAACLFRETLKSYQWFAIGLEFTGIVILTVHGTTLSLNSGTLWLLFAAFLLSVYNLLQRRLTKNYSALQSTTYSIIAGTLMLALFAPASVNELREAPPIQLIYILLLGTFSSAIAYVAWAKAFALAKNTASVSNYMFFTPFVTGVLGFILAGEIPESSIWTGGTCILAGALLFNKEAVFRSRA